MPSRRLSARYRQPVEKCEGEMFGIISTLCGIYSACIAHTHFSTHTRTHSPSQHSVHTKNVNIIVMQSTDQHFLKLHNNNKNYFNLYWHTCSVLFGFRWCDSEHRFRLLQPTCPWKLDYGGVHRWRVQQTHEKKKNSKQSLERKNRIFISVRAFYARHICVHTPIYSKYIWTNVVWRSFHDFLLRHQRVSYNVCGFCRRQS